MKRLFYLLLLLLSSAVVLAGCGGGAAAPEPEVAAEPVSEESVVESGDTAVVPEHNKYNLSLIGNTGRPQFLNAYATW